MPPGWCGCCCCCWRWHELVGLFGCEIRSLTVPRVRWVRPTEIKKEKALLLTLLEKVRASSQEREAPLLPVLELDSYHAQTQVSVGNQSSKLRKEEEKKWWQQRCQRYTTTDYKKVPWKWRRKLGPSMHPAAPSCIIAMNIRQNQKRKGKRKLR